MRIASVEQETAAHPGRQHCKDTIQLLPGSSQLYSTCSVMYNIVSKC